MSSNRGGGEQNLSIVEILKNTKVEKRRTPEQHVAKHE
jgi:hypothetical protein